MHYATPIQHIKQHQSKGEYTPLMTIWPEPQLGMERVRRLRKALIIDVNASLIFASIAAPIAIPVTAAAALANAITIAALTDQLNTYQEIHLDGNNLTVKTYGQTDWPDIHMQAHWAQAEYVDKNSFGSNMDPYIKLGHGQNIAIIGKFLPREELKDLAVTLQKTLDDYRGPA